MSNENLTQIESELQRVRDALRDEDAYARAAERIAALRGWRRSRCPVDTLNSWKSRLCRLLGAGRHCSLRDYALLVSEIGYSPIDFTRFTGGHPA